MCIDTVLWEVATNDAFPILFCVLSAKENVDTSHVRFERLWSLPTGLKPRQLIYGHVGEKGLKGHTFLCCVISLSSLSTALPSGDLSTKFINIPHEYAVHFLADGHS